MALGLEIFPFVYDEDQNAVNFSLPMFARLVKRVAVEEAKDFPHDKEKQIRTMNNVRDQYGQNEKLVFVNNYEDLFAKAEPITPKEALNLDNMEQRQAALSIFDPGEVIQHMNAELVDRQTIEKKQKSFSVSEDGELVETEKVFEDTYELYRYSYAQLMKDSDDRGWGFRDTSDLYVYFVKCGCPSTGRVYYIHVDPEIEGNTKDAIAAIASTMYVPEDVEVEQIFRHGDVVVCKTKEKVNSDEHSYRPMTKEEYCEKLVVET